MQMTAIVVSTEVMNERKVCPAVDAQVLVPVAEECAVSKFNNWMSGFASPICGTRRRCQMLPGAVKAEDIDLETNGPEEREDEEDEKKEDKEADE